MIGVSIQMLTLARPHRTEAADVQEEESAAKLASTLLHHKTLKVRVGWTMLYGCACVAWLARRVRGRCQARCQAVVGTAAGPQQKGAGGAAPHLPPAACSSCACTHTPLRAPLPTQASPLVPSLRHRSK